MTNSISHSETFFVRVSYLDDNTSLGSETIQSTHYPESLFKDKDFYPDLLGMVKAMRNKSWINGITMEGSKISITIRRNNVLGNILQD